MKYKLLTIVLFFLSFQLTAQETIFYDAQFIREKCYSPVTGKLGNRINLVEVLKKYYPSGANIDPTLLKDNPFFKPYTPDLFAAGGVVSFLEKTASSVGGLNVTNFADGLAKFLVKRFKEELSITFFQKFKEEMEKYEELKTLFPNTRKVLLAIDRDIYVFNVYLNTLREAFIKDLTNLYTNFKKVKELPTYQAYFSTHKEMLTIVSNVFFTIDQYANGVHPGKVIENYDPNELINFTDVNVQTNIQNAIKTIKLFSISLKSASADTYWVTSDSVRAFLKDPVARDIYFGLIYLKAEGINFVTQGGNKTFKELLKTAKETATQIDDYKKKVETIVDHAQEVNEYIADLKAKKKQEIDYNDYYKLFNSAIDLLEDGLTLVNLTPLNIDPALVGKINLCTIKWIAIARTTAELYVDIRTKNYSSAILNTITIIDSIWDNTNDSKVRTAILKYGNFAATVAQAENSDEVEKAIEAIALPSGSSRIKRESAFNVSLNAYAGAFVGGEHLPALKTKQNAWSVGATAPVGIAFSWGNIKRSKNKDRGGKSITIFVPLIDVGAIAAFRLQNDSSKVASDVELKNIISPGLYVYYGFGKCPISIGFGAQAGPQIRTVTAENVNIDKNFYIRWGLTVAVDIPLLNFHTKSKKE
ncbi:MAG: hypothetical protein QM731_06220 [Chitinophagaceae bacterium]